jgi:predicted PurR-regulated permease PerM
LSKGQISPASLATWAVIPILVGETVNAVSAYNAWDQKTMEDGRELKQLRKLNLTSKSQSNTMSDEMAKNQESLSSRFENSVVDGIFR